MSSAGRFTPIELGGDSSAAEAGRARRADMRQAAEELYDLHRMLAKTGDNVVGELLKGEASFYEWDHYPPGDVYDRETHAQYYYHAHPAGERAEDEHGHFHTFLRPEGMPEGVEPAPVADYEAPEDPNDALSHLIAISMNSRGLPVRLFTVNRWVTGEVWYAADDVVRMLDRFAIDHTQPSWPVNYWINRMVRLFRPQIEALVESRDEAIERLRHAAGDAVFEDREIDVISYCDISLERQIEAARAAPAD